MVEWVDKQLDKVTDVATDENQPEWKRMLAMLVIAVIVPYIGALLIILGAFAFLACAGVLS